MFFYLLQEISVSPFTTVSSECNVTLNSDVLAYSRCDTTLSARTTFDFENRVVTVLGAPLDTFSCSRFVYRMNNGIIKNANFVLNVTIDADPSCKKQVFGLFDTTGVSYFSLNNVYVSGNVYIDKNVDAVVGQVFAYQGMNFQPDSDGVQYSVPLRSGGRQSLNLPSVQNIAEQFSIGYDVKVFRIKQEVFDEIPQRNYTALQLDECTTWTNETSWNASEYSSNYFPFNNYAFENLQLPSGYKDYKYNKMAAFTLYLGSSLENLPITVTKGISVLAKIPGVTTQVSLSEGYDADMVGRCLDAQVFLRSQPLLVSMNYSVFGNAACSGCSCKICPQYLVATPAYADSYCTEQCPQGSYRMGHVCLGSCPFGMQPDDADWCMPTTCKGFQLMLPDGTCRDATVKDSDNNPLPWPHRKVVGIDGIVYDFGGDHDYANTTLRTRCPVVLDYQCYTTCPPGYQTLEYYGNDGYINMECHTCGSFGLHGWYAGKCWSACPNDLVSENSICVAKCSPGKFNDAYFCVSNCKSGYALGSECVSVCPANYIISRDIRRCYHNCPVNMHLQDGMCVYTCDYGMAFNSESQKCESCADGYAWNDGQCLSITSKDCPYQTFDQGILKCQSACEYGQMRSGTTCITLDKEQGNFTTFQACDFIKEATIWNEQFFCFLEAEASDFTANIRELHKVSDCEFASMDMSSLGSVKNAVFAYNVTMQMPSECSAINITLFLGVGQLSNISVVGKINITNTSSKSNISFAMTQNTSTVNEAKENLVKQNLSVYITGGTVNVTQKLASKDAVAKLENLTAIDAMLTNFSMGGQNMQIYFQNDSLMDLSVLPSILEFFDDMDSLKLVVKQAGSAVTYYTSALSPKIFSRDDKTVVECSAGQAVRCTGATCICQAGIGALFLYGVSLLNQCDNSLYYDTAQKQCYDICPDGYGAAFAGQQCTKCEYYSMYGLCVQHCPGFSYQKTCISGDLQSGFVAMGNVTIRCGESNTNPFFESGKCVEQCSDGLSLYNQECVAICPQGLFTQFSVDLGYSECVTECSDGYFQQAFTCQVNCSDVRFKKYRECRYDCLGSSFEDQCLDKCPVGYVAVEGKCVTCTAPKIYNMKTKLCEETCEAAQIVNVGDLVLCCSADSTDEQCAYRASSEQTTQVIPQFIDGNLEKQDCKFMMKSTIWAETKCVLSEEMNYLLNKEIINIIDMRMEEQISDNDEVECKFYVLDVDHQNINKVLFYFDVQLVVPEYCSLVTISTFGNVDSANITEVSLTGMISVSFLGKSVVPNVKNVINAQQDDDSYQQKIQLQSTVTIASKTANDHIGGTGYETDEETHTMKFGFGEQYHFIYYAGESYDEVLAQYYAVMQYHRDSADLMEYDDSYSSLRPITISADSSQVTTCPLGKVIDAKTRQCVAACEPGTRLLGTLCIDDNDIEVYSNTHNQVFTQCPPGSYANELSGFCEECPLTKFFQNGQCVTSCKNGLYKNGRYCVSSCPIGTQIDGIYCVAVTSTYNNEDGILVTSCGSQSANQNKTCQIACLPGQYIKASECVSSCTGQYYIQDNECLPIPADVTNPCSLGQYLYKDSEGQQKCLVNCPSGYWAIGENCVLDDEEKGCTDPMSYRDAILKRCVPCYVKAGAGQDQQCSDCTSVNRTDATNLTIQYCQECSFFYYQQTDSTDQLETKFCTDQCPPNPVFLTASEKDEYSLLKFPLTTTAGGKTTTECRRYCDKASFSNELTNTPQCTELCKNGFESVIKDTSGNTIYQRCIKSCGIYPDENPIAESKTCSSNCSSIAKYRVSQIDSLGYQVFICQTTCNKKYQYAYSANDILCSDSCPSGYLAKQLAGSADQYECVASCDQNSDFKFQNWGNNTCVKSCANSPLHQEVYLNGQQCSTSCEYYKEYSFNIDDETAVQHSVNYQCVSTCALYFLDNFGRKICYDSCPKFAKYKVRDAQGIQQCVNHCAREDQFISNSLCVDACPEPYITAERIVINNTKIDNKICIAASACVSPLAKEYITYGKVKYTHCTYCNQISLNDAPFTSTAGVCQQENCGIYTIDLQCLDACPAVQNGVKLYKSITNSSLCLACVTRDGDKCIAGDICSDYIQEDDSSLCKANCGTAASTTYMYHVEFNARNQPQKVCGETSSCLIIPSKIEANNHLMCYGNCYNTTEGTTVTYANSYFLEGYGCISDCFEYGAYYPFVKVSLVDEDDETYDFQYCSTKADCVTKYPSSTIITVNETTESADRDTFKPGTCVGSTGNCISKFYVKDDNIQRCVQLCNVFNGIYDPSATGAQQCANTFTPNNQRALYYDWNLKMFEILTTQQCTAMPSYSVNVERMCIKRCPYQLHMYTDGECHNVPTCAPNQVVQANTDEDGKVTSFTCVLLGTSDIYFYLDGIKYKGSSFCSKIAGSKECMLFTCPPGFFYLHGVCTTYCENQTALACVDITEGNIFASEGNGIYRRIPEISCPTTGGSSRYYRLVGFPIQGSMVFICSQVDTSQYFAFSDSRTLLSTTYYPLCALNKSNTFATGYNFRSYCANPLLYPVYQNETVNRSPMPVTVATVPQNSHLYYLGSIGYYSASTQTTSCSDTICSPQCEALTQVYYHGQCVNRVEPKANEMYMMYNNRKHMIPAIDCITQINDRECAPISCPSVMIGDQNIDFFYHQGICVSGCVRNGTGVCQKYELGNIFDSVSYTSRAKQQCNTLLMKADKNAYFFSWECSFETSCSTGYSLVGTKYCVLNTYISNSGIINFIFSEDTVPVSKADIQLDLTKQEDKLKCQVFRTVTIGSTNYYLCVSDYKDKCGTLGFDSGINAFICRESSYCQEQTEADFASTGICAPKCAGTGKYLVRGTCITTSKTCTRYNADGTDCVTDTTDKYFMKVSEVEFEVSAANVARTLTETTSTVTYVQPFICPKDTHYYYRGLCIRRCVRANDYECSDSTAGKYFDVNLEAQSTPSGDSTKISTVDLGYGKYCYEILGVTSSCKSYQLMVGTQCISKSIILDNIDSLGGNCVMTSGDVKDLSSLCTTDVVVCNTYVTIAIDKSHSVRVCSGDNNQVDCQNSNYMFNETLQRFECYQEECGANGYTVDGKFCFTKCPSGENRIFGKCVKESEALEDDTTESYQMVKGKKYAKSTAAGKTIEFKGKMEKEVAYFICPTGYYYLENRCKSACPVDSVTANITGGSKDITVQVCLRSCPFFFQGQGCTDLCDESNYASIVYMEPYVNYMCSTTECIGTEYTIINEESTIYPKLCLSKARLSTYPEIPANQVFVYNTKPTSWSDLFVDYKGCSTYFVSSVDSKLLVCADVTENLPQSYGKTMQFDFAMKMFNYKQCTVGYYTVENTCYPNQPFNSAYVMDDTLLKIYDPIKKGSYSIAENNTELYHKQGSCEIYQYQDGDKCVNLPTRKNEDETCTFYYTRAAYNTSTGLANEAVYFLVDPEKVDANMTTISTTSCEIVTGYCPTHLGYHYFENVCVRKCSTNTQDSEDKYTKNCAEYLGYDGAGKLVRRNMLTLKNASDDKQGYVLYTQDTSLIMFAEVFSIQQYIVHVVSEETFPEDETMVYLDYNSQTYAVSPAYSLKLRGENCVIGMEYDAQYLQDLCSYNCKIYVEQQVSGQTVKKCFEPILPAAFVDYVECNVYVYNEKINMYQCLDSSPICQKDQIICQEECIDSEASGQIFLAAVGCIPKQCTGDVAYNTTSRYCSRIKDVDTGKCNGYVIQRGTYKGFATMCDPELRNDETCECKAIMPCIMSQSYFNDECVSYTTCKYVVMTSPSEWKCGTTCPPTYGKQGNLCTNLGYSDKYLVLQMNLLDKTPWYVAIGGIGVFIILGIAMVVQAAVLYRKVNANKALKKSKRDDKVGYHERLNQMSGAGAGKKKVDTDKAQKNVGRRTE